MDAFNAQPLNSNLVRLHSTKKTRKSYVYEL